MEGQGSPKERDAEGRGRDRDRERSTAQNSKAQNRAVPLSSCTHVMWCGVVWCGVLWCGVQWSNCRRVGHGSRDRTVTLRGGWVGFLIKLKKVAQRGGGGQAHFGVAPQKPVHSGGVSNPGPGRSLLIIQGGIRTNPEILTWGGSGGLACMAWPPGCVWLPGAGVREARVCCAAEKITIKRNYSPEPS